ncbi:hypothetical protein [Microcystis aeruginosa]|nr:hypothetical protein [Microcystis aeruginosa]MBE9244218.1 hypothetical protein [Microcystis aeruginosa LEGE 00239]WOB67620.1 hypothetical protein PJW00_19010 [Microcystis aeruginosa LE3]
MKSLRYMDFSLLVPLSEIIPILLPSTQKRKEPLVKAKKSQSSQSGKM